MEVGILTMAVPTAVPTAVPMVVPMAWECTVGKFDKQSRDQMSLRALSFIYYAWKIKLLAQRCSLDPSC